MYAGHPCSGRQSPWPENRRGRELHVPSLYRENSESATIAKLSCTGPNRESLARTGLYTPVLAKRSQNFLLADGLAADYSPQFGQHPVTARHANLT